MYEHLFHFFGLRENPFHVSPDPRFYFSTPAHDAAIAELQFGVDTRQGFIVLTGESGTGKTTVLNHFLNWLQARHQSSSYIFHSLLKPVELFEFILRDFGVPCPSREKGDLLDALHQWLIKQHTKGDSPVLVIDEAQAISVRTLDQIRLLLNLETPGSKLLQIVLAGQPELEEKLQKPELRQLRQRVMFRCKLLPLSLEQTTQYVKSRLASAGASNQEIFTQESLAAAHMYARGIPRTVNLLCEHALIVAYADRLNVISTDMIRRVAADFDLTPPHADAPDAQMPSRFGRLLPFRPEEQQILEETQETEFAEVPTEEPVNFPARAPQETWSHAPLATADAPVRTVPPPLIEVGLLLLNPRNGNGHPFLAALANTSRAIPATSTPSNSPPTPDASQQTPASPRTPSVIRRGLAASAPITQALAAQMAAARATVVRAAPTLAVNTPATPLEKPEEVAPPGENEPPETPSFARRFLRYWMEVKDSLISDWKYFIAPVSTVKVPETAPPAANMRAHSAGPAIPRRGKNRVPPTTARKRRKR